MDTQDYGARLEALLPDGWRTLRRDMWVHAMSPRFGAVDPTPDQGFKIHVSATEEHAVRILELVVPGCIEAGVDFKVVADLKRHRDLNGKRQRRESSGKFMTIYPTEQGFVPLIAQLHERTRGGHVAGPRVLSDRRYEDSELISYRYGGFRPMSRVSYDGTLEHLISAPDGTLVADERKPWFQLPEWVTDPLERRSEEPLIGPEPQVVLDERFAVEGYLRFSNSGGIYAATDLSTGLPVVVKEARPHTHVWTTTGQPRDAVDLLHHEHAVLVRLEGLDVVPRPVSLFTEGGHTFLAQQRIPGVTFNAFCASHEMVIAPYLHRPERIAPWAEAFFVLAENLLDAVGAVHGRDMLIGDLSPGNLMVDPETRHVRLVDLESAVSADDDPVVLRHAARWVTPGFFRPGRLSSARPTVADDMYAAAMVLYSALFPVTPFFAVKPSAYEEFLDFFVLRGVPVEVREVIAALVDGSVVDARAAVERGMR